MDSHQYEAVKSVKGPEERKKESWKPFLRQLFVSTCVWVNFFTLGLWLGSPTVVIPQLRREANSIAAVSDEMESWLSSVFGYAALPWAVIFPFYLRRCGRKYPFIFASACALTSFIIYYCSSNAVQILVAEIMEGIIFASNSTVSMLIITEFTSPRNRGMFLTLKSASMNIAICIANAMGTFFHWKSIPILGIVCSVYSFGAVFLPESPYWLASVGKFEECRTSHRWLKGKDEESEKELQNLIETQEKYRVSNFERRVSCSWVSCKGFIEKIKCKQFYKPTLLSILMTALYNFSGKPVCVIYATQIIKRISNNESIAYKGMLILDGITVLGMYCGCGLSKILKRRTLLFTASIVGALSLYILSIYLYLVKLSLISEHAVASLILLIIFSISISCGPLIMASSIYAELIPLRCKTLSIIVSVLCGALLHATILKLSPRLFGSCGMHGTFLFFGVSLTLCIYLLYKFLPETKDKTLQEIENYFKDYAQTSEELKQLNTEK